MIVSGGDNVYPVGVENTLTAHPDVAEGSVVGMADTPCIRDELAACKVPREITALGELPRIDTGEVPRRRMHAPAADG